MFNGNEKRSKQIIHNTSQVLLHTFVSIIISYTVTLYYKCICHIVCLSLCNVIGSFFRSSQLLPMKKNLVVRRMM